MKDELKNIQSMTSDDIDFKKQILSLKNIVFAVGYSSLVFFISNFIIWRYHVLYVY